MQMLTNRTINLDDNMADADLIDPLYIAVLGNRNSARRINAIIIDCRHDCQEMWEDDVAAEEPAPAAEAEPEPGSEPPPMEGGEGEQAAAPAPEEDQPPPKFRPSRDPDRPLKFRYWSRPTTLQYKYLYDYRHNYYSDVIDYLDNRSRGIKSDIPRPQTWAERALRTYTSPKKSEALAKREKDIELLNNIRASNFLYQYHTKDYLYRKYPALTL